MAGTRDVSRASLYRGSINLWVEDELTRAYLPTVWDSPDVAFFTRQPIISFCHHGSKSLRQRSAKRRTQTSGDYWRTRTPLPLNRFPTDAGRTNSPARRYFEMWAAGSAIGPIRQSSPVTTQQRPSSMRILPRRSVPGSDEITPFRLISSSSSRH